MVQLCKANNRGQQQAAVVAVLYKGENMHSHNKVSAAESSTPHQAASAAMLSNTTVETAVSRQRGAATVHDGYDSAGVSPGAMACLPLKGTLEVLTPASAVMQALS